MTVSISTTEKTISIVVVIGGYKPLLSTPVEAASLPVIAKAPVIIAGLGKVHAVAARKTI